MVDRFPEVEAQFYLFPPPNRDSWEQWYPGNFSRVGRLLSYQELLGVDEGGSRRFIKFRSVKWVALRFTLGKQGNFSKAFPINNAACVSSLKRGTYIAIEIIHFCSFVSIQIWLIRSWYQEIDL